MHLLKVLWYQRKASYENRSLPPIIFIFMSQTLRMVLAETNPLASTQRPVQATLREVEITQRAVPETLLK